MLKISSGRPSTALGKATTPLNRYGAKKLHLGSTAAAKRRYQKTGDMWVKK
jgi:hypothetical protein